MLAAIGRVLHRRLGRTSARFCSEGKTKGRIYVRVEFPCRSCISPDWNELQLHSCQHRLAECLRELTGRKSLGIFGFPNFTSFIYQVSKVVRITIVRSSSVGESTRQEWKDPASEEEVWGSILFLALGLNIMLHNSSYITVIFCSCYYYHWMIRVNVTYVTRDGVQHKVRGKVSQFHLEDFWLRGKQTIY